MSRLRATRDRVYADAGTMAFRVFPTSRSNTIANMAAAEAGYEPMSSFINQFYNVTVSVINSHYRPSYFLNLLF